MSIRLNLIAAVLLPATLSIPVLYAAPSPETATLSVSGHKIGTLDYGMGWNMVGTVPADTSEKSRWYQYLAWSGCDIVRLKWAMGDFEAAPDAAGNDTYHYNWNAFDLGSLGLKPEIDKANECEHLGIDYIFCQWEPTGWWKDWWMEKHGTLPDNPDLFGKCEAAFVHLMTQNHAHPHFRAISVQNEPDIAYTDANGRRDWYPTDRFWSIVVSTDKHLKALGDRNKIDIVGPETCWPVTSPSYSDVAMLSRYGAILDGVGDHLYAPFYGTFDYADPKKCLGSTTLPFYADLKPKLRALYGHDVPVLLGEYSCRTGEHLGLTPAEVYDDNLCNAEIVVRLMNVGVGGFIQWCFSDNTVPPWDNREPQLNALTRNADHRLVPQAAVYFPHAVLARYVRKGWAVLQSDVIGGADGNGVHRLFASALHEPRSGNVTLLLVNDDYSPKSIRIRLSDFNLNRTLHAVFVLGPAPDGVRRGADVSVSHNQAQATIQARSVLALTTMPVGDLELPLKLAGRRLVSR